jgi:hypothetical protein
MFTSYSVLLSTGYTGASYAGLQLPSRTITFEEACIQSPNAWRLLTLLRSTRQAGASHREVCLISLAFLLTTAGTRPPLHQGREGAMSLRRPSRVEHYQTAVLTKYSTGIGKQPPGGYYLSLIDALTVLPSYDPTHTFFCCPTIVIRYRTRRNGTVTLS